MKLKSHRGYGDSLKITLIASAHSLSGVKIWIELLYLRVKNCRR